MKSRFCLIYTNNHKENFIVKNIAMGCDRAAGMKLIPGLQPPGFDYVAFCLASLPLRSAWRC